MGGPKHMASAALLSVLVGVSAASAAEMGALPVIEAPELAPVPAEIGFGWYLRGDVGFAHRAERIGHGADPDFAKVDADDDSWLVGAGVGFRFSKRFRADLTVDWRRQDVAAVCPVGCVGAVAVGPETVIAAADMWTGLANGYVDLGSWHGITPYVGAGVGASYLDPSLPGSDLGDFPHSWHVAAALMAGVAVSVDESFKIDAGYRYLWRDTARSDTDALGNPVEYRTRAAHEFRVGVRLMMD